MKTALITGASAGLGREFAFLFAKDGHSLILVARRVDRLNEIAEAILSIHPNITVTVIGLDLGQPGAGQMLFDQVKQKNLSVDYLVNNAGFGLSGAFKDLSLNKQLQMMDLNMRTLVELTYLFLPEMIERGHGRILNVGSTAGFQPGPYMNVYYATKAFVNSLSEALQDELKGTGVSCTVLAPGATATEFAESAHAEKSMLFKVLPLATSKGVAEYGYQSMLAGKSLAIHGWMNRLMVQSQRLLPRFVARNLAGRLNR